MEIKARQGQGQGADCSRAYWEQPSSNGTSTRRKDSSDGAAPTVKDCPEARRPGKGRRRKSYRREGRLEASRWVKRHPREPLGRGREVKGSPMAAAWTGEGDDAVLETCRKQLYGACTREEGSEQKFARGGE